MQAPSTEDFRILIVEDETIIACDIARIVEEAGQRVVGQVANADAALEAAARWQADLALMDIRIVGSIDGIDCARRLWRDLMVPVIFVTAHADDDIVRRAAQPGVLGFVVKPFEERQFLTTLKLARARCQSEKAIWRDAWYHSAMVDAFLRIADEIDSTRHRLRQQATSADEPVWFSGAMLELTSREREVLRMLMNNHRVPAIADTLSISQHTVRNHLKGIYRKLGVGSQAQLIERVRHLAHPLV